MDRLRDNFSLIIVILVSTAFCFFSSRIDLTFYLPYSFSDLGHQLYNYKMTFLGEIPYRDFWENWAPGTFYLNALAFKMFGVSIYSTKLLLALITVISSTVLFCISKKIVPKPIALAISLVSLLWGNFTLNIPYSGWFSNCFGLLALLGFTGYLSAQKRNFFHLMLTGTALGFAFTFKQNMGILNLIAIAIATAVSIHATESLESAGDGPDSGTNTRFRALVIFLELVLLLPGYLGLPYFFVRERYAAGVTIDATAMILFFLPIVAINSLVPMFLWNLEPAHGKHYNYRKLFRKLLLGEMALAGGFSIVTIPWVAYFSSIIGWRDYYRMLFLMHPMQEGFKEAYINFGSLGAPPVGKILSFVLLLSLCTLLAFLAIMANSRRRLYASLAVCAIISVAAGRIFVSIDARIEQMLYFPLLLEALFFVNAAREFKTNASQRLDSGQSLIVLTIAIFSVYNFSSLSIFSDRVHYQMTVFPWLILAGYLSHRIFRIASSYLLSPEYALHRRKAVILASVALVFFGPYIKKPLCIFYNQYSANEGFQRIHAQGSGKERNKGILRKMEGSAGGIYINSAFLRDIEGIVQYICHETDKEDYVFGGPSTALFNFLTERRFPSKYRYFLFNFLSDEQQTELLRELAEKKPKYIIYDSAPSAPLDAEKFFWQLPAVGQYISMNYRFDRRIGRFDLFKRITGVNS